MATQRVSRRTMGLAVLLSVGLATLAARAQPPIDGPPPPGLPPLPSGLPPLPVGLPTDRLTGPPDVGPGMDPEEGNRPMPGPAPGRLFRPPGPQGPPVVPAPGLDPGRAPAGPLGPGPDLNRAATGLLGTLRSTLTYFHTFWLLAALNLGLVIVAMLAILVILMRLLKRSAAEPGEHFEAERGVEREHESEMRRGGKRKSFEHRPTRDAGRSPRS